MNFVTFLCLMLGNSRFVIKIKPIKLKPCNKFRVRIGQIHDDGGKKMIEDIPELKQFSPFAFSMLNNSRFVIKIKPIKLKPCNEISRQIKQLWREKDDRRNTCAEMIIKISDNYAE